MHILLIYSVFIIIVNYICLILRYIIQSFLLISNNNILSMEEQSIKPSEDTINKTAAMTTNSLISSNRIDRIDMFKEPLVALGIEEYDPIVISAIAEYARSNLIKLIYLYSILSIYFIIA